MYREFEPNGDPLPSNGRLVLRTILLPIATFIVLALAVLAFQYHGPAASRRIAEWLTYGAPPSGPGGIPPSGGSSSR